MKRPILFSLLISTALAESAFGQSTDIYRFEAESGVSVLQLVSPYRTGWQIRQQLTGYFRPRLGLALGVGRGHSANDAPLGSLNASPPPANQPDPAQLRAFYRQQDNMTDVSLVGLPVLSPHHQLKLQLGLSLYRRRKLVIDSVYFDAPGSAAYRTTGLLTDTRQLVPMASVNYDYRLSNRWAIGLNGTAYLTTPGPTTTLGLRGTYRFNVSGDSLGVGPVNWNEWHTGLRLGSGLVGENGMGTGAGYRLQAVAGLWAELPLSLVWSLRAELNYTQRGYRHQAADLGTIQYLAGSARLDYLEIPLLFRHELAYRWHVYTGPYLAFFLHGYTETAGVRNPSISPNTLAGLMAGTSYNLTKRLSADLRYQRDLVQFSSTPYDGFHGVQLALGWAFH